MLRKFIAFQRAKTARPGFTFWTLATCWNFLARAQNKEVFPIKRFMRANRLPLESHPCQTLANKSVGVLFVAAGKDLEVLQWSIPFAVRSLGTSTPAPKISVIVPSEDLNHCRKLLGDHANIEIESEDSYVSKELVEALKLRFQSRFGWALQQFLKISFVLESSLDAILIVDADTVLLEERRWISDSGRQILTPSDEFNISYYEFLSTIGIGKVVPEYTFVSHHMLMQPKFLRLACEQISKSFPDEILELVLNHDFKNTSSPFSIDYEFYAQFLINHHPDKVELLKWSNLGIPRLTNLADQIEKEVKKNTGRFFSLSFHSYL
jgi:hypothetical protein